MKNKITVQCSSKILTGILIKAMPMAYAMRETFYVATYNHKTTIHHTIEEQPFQTYHNRGSLSWTGRCNTIRVAIYYIR